MATKVDEAMRRVAIPTRLLKGRMLPLRCLVTGAREGVELRQVTLYTRPWWLFPAGLVTLRAAYALMSDHLPRRLWVPLSAGPWRWHRTEWLWLPPLNVLLIGLSATVTTLLADRVRGAAGVGGIAAIFVAMLFALSYLAQALQEPHMVWFEGGDLELGVVLRLPDAAVAAALRAEVVAMSTAPERETIAATLA